MILFSSKNGGKASPRLLTRLGAKLLSSVAWAEVARSLKLSEREAQIAHGVLDDLSEAQMAACAGTSPHTVHTYLRRLYSKLGVADRVQLTLFIVQEYLRLTALPGSALPPLCRHYRNGRCPRFSPPTVP